MQAIVAGGLPEGWSVIEHIKQSSISVLYLLSLCFFDGNFGAFSSQASHLIGSFALLSSLIIATGYVARSESGRISRGHLAKGATTVAALVLIVTAPAPAIWLAASAMLAFTVTLWTGPRAAWQWNTLGLTATLYIMLKVFLNPVAAFWLFTIEASAAVTNLLGSAIGRASSFGPSVSGWWVCVLFLCYFFARFIHARRLSVLLKGLASVIVAYAVFNLLNAYNPPISYHHHGGLNIVNSQILCFALASISLFAFGGARDPVDAQAGKKPTGRNRVLLAASAQVLILLATAAHYFVADGGAGGGTGQVVIYGAEPSATFNNPSFDRLGVGNSGMYGLLAKYVGSRGYRVTVVGTEDGLNDAMGGARLLIVISPTSVFSPETHERVWQFVAGGGGLLVMGDHTDIYGMMAPLNTLLGPVNTKFNFDSGYPSRAAWRYSHESFRHPVTRSLEGVNESLQYGTGATLSLSPPAYPVVTGRYAFSDKGDYLNGEAGGFLGDNVYTPDERLGDLALVVAAEHGAGRVLVFGDTSTFQNIALPYSHQFVSDSLSWLSGGGSFRHQTILYFSFFFLALAAAAFLATGQIKQSIPMAITTATLTTGLLISVSARPAAPGSAPEAGHRVAYVDASHVGDFKLRHWEDESIDGLLVNLSRNGYLPFVMTEFSEEWLKASELFVSVSPLRAYSADEERALYDFIDKGGRAVVAVGYEESAASRAMLARLGFRIELVPLGAAPITDFVLGDEEFEKIKQEPHFGKAWPVATTDGSPAEVLYSYEGFPIVVAKSQGSGSVIVIGDGRFLRDKVLENEKAAWPGNVNFLKKLFGSSGPPAGTQ